MRVNGFKIDYLPKEQQWAVQGRNVLAFVQTRREAIAIVTVNSIRLQSWVGGVSHETKSF